MLTYSAFAQAETAHVVYLANGSVMWGQVTRVKPGESVTLRASDGNVFVWGMDEIKEVKLEEAYRPAAPLAVDPSGIALSDLEALGVLESTHRSLQGSLRKMDRAKALGWAGVAGCVIGVVTWFDGALARTHEDNDGQVRAGVAIAVGGAVTMIVASAIKSRVMGEIRDLKETVGTQALGIAKPANKGKRGGRTRF